MSFRKWVIPDTGAIQRSIREMYDIGLILTTERINAGPRGYHAGAVSTYAAGMNELAEVSGLPRRTIERLWHGENNRVNYNTLDKLAIALNTHPDRLLIPEPDTAEMRRKYAQQWMREKRAACNQ